MSRLQKMFDKAPPASVEAEKAVISCMLHGGQCDLVASEFSDLSMRAIFNAIIDTGNHDLVAVKINLQESNQLDKIGGIDTLIEVSELQPSAASIAHFAAIVRETAAKRELILAASLLLDDAYNTSLSAAEIRTRAGAHIDSVTISTEQPSHLPQRTIGYATRLFDISPEPIKALFCAIRGPKIRMSDTNLLLVCYAIAGTLAAKKIVVSNSYMVSNFEHFYTNQCVLFVNASGKGKSGIIGIIGEILDMHNEVLANNRKHFSKTNIQRNMSSGPKGLLANTFGTHHGLIKQIAQKNANETAKYIPTKREMVQATEEYKAHLWQERDAVYPECFIVDELAEKIAAVSELSNETVISVLSSGPHARQEVQFNDIGVAYGYGSAISLYGNGQTALMAESFFDSAKNSSSGLLGRCLPICNDFNAEESFGESANGLTIRNVIAHMTGILSNFEVNGCAAEFDGTAPADFLAGYKEPCGIAPEKLYIMAQRLIGSGVPFGFPAMEEAYQLCLRLLSDLYQEMYLQGVKAQAEALDKRARDRVMAAIMHAIEGCKRGQKKSVTQFLSSVQWRERDLAKDILFEIMSGRKDFSPYSRGKNDIAGYVRN